MKFPGNSSSMAQTAHPKAPLETAHKWLKWLTPAAAHRPAPHPMPHVVHRRRAHARASPGQPAGKIDRAMDRETLQAYERGTAEIAARHRAFTAAELHRLILGFFHAAQPTA